MARTWEREGGGRIRRLKIRTKRGDRRGIREISSRIEYQTPV